MRNTNLLLPQTLAYSFLCAAIALSGAFSPAHAKWFSQKKTPEQEAVEKVQTYQPPPPEALTQYCEPFRAEAVALHQKFFLVRPFYEPRIAWLVHKHQKCRHELMTQEFTYLKHADIEQAPSLPKIDSSTGKTGGPNGNLP